MKLVLCPYGHQNQPDARFCTTCKLPIPPDPTRVDDDDIDDDPDPIPVVPQPPDEVAPVPGPDPEPDTRPELPPDPSPPTGTICSKGHWNPPDQERWCQVCAEPLYEEPAVEEEEVPFPWGRVAIGVGVVVFIVGIVFVIGALGDDPPVVTGQAEDSTTTTTEARTTTTTAISTTTTAFGDLGLGIPMARPDCDGSYITLIGASVEPARYLSEIAQLIDSNPGSNYLRTDVTCLSLRQELEGNPIYAAYYGPYATLEEACDARNLGPAGAYVKPLDNVSDPNVVPECG